MAALTDIERTDCRRYLGYPAFGVSANGGTMQSYRFFQAYGLMEFKLSNISDPELVVVRTTYLAQLVLLEAAILTAGANLDTDHAAVWTRNRNEMRDRAALFDGWRMRFCEFLGLPPGPALTRTSGRIVV